MKRTPKQLVKNYIFVILGSVLYALSFDWFFEPNAIGFGGITGLAQIINHFFPLLTIGVLVILLNIPLFLAGWKLFGTHMLVSSIFAMAFSSALIDIFPLWISFPPMDDVLLGCIMGGVLLGLGLGLMFLQGATSGGTEIVARLLKVRFAWLPVGKLLLFSDLTVVALVALVFRNMGTALYGVVGIYISTAVMDWVLYGLDNAKVAYIISERPEEICSILVHEMDRGVTILHGEGAYSGNPKKVLMCAFKQREIVAVKETVQRVDPDAFMIVTAAHEVLGEGFGSYHNENY